MEGRLGVAQVFRGDRFGADVGHLAELGADLINLAVPVCSKLGVDAVCSEEVVELVLVLHTLRLHGLTVLGEYDTELITVIWVIVAEVESAIGVLVAVASGSAREIVAVVFVVVFVVFLWL